MKTMRAALKTLATGGDSDVFSGTNEVVAHKDNLDYMVWRVGAISPLNQRIPRLRKWGYLWMLVVYVNHAYGLCID